jgi:predicted regulator of Ras-like GTPase activity (Roadblock/LC7/MglB family)
MPADAAPSAAVAPNAERALGYLREMSPDLRGAAILSAEGAVLAASGDPEEWREAAAEFIKVADAAGDEPIEQAHVATEEGEVFAVRSGGLVAIAVTERFTLASLMLFDMRTVLRDLANGGAS